MFHARALSLLSLLVIVGYAAYWWRGVDRGLSAGQNYDDDRARWIGPILEATKRAEVELKTTNDDAGRERLIASALSGYKAIGESRSTRYAQLRDELSALKEKKARASLAAERRGLCHITLHLQTEPSVTLMVRPSTKPDLKGWFGGAEEIVLRVDGSTGAPVRIESLGMKFASATLVTELLPGTNFLWVQFKRTDSLPTPRCWITEGDLFLPKSNGLRMVWYADLRRQCGGASTGFLSTTDVRFLTRASPNEPQIHAVTKVWARDLKELEARRMLPASTEVESLQFDAARQEFIAVPKK